MFEKLFNTAKDLTGIKLKPLDLAELGHLIKDKDQEEVIREQVNAVLFFYTYGVSSDEVDSIILQYRNIRHARGSKEELLNYYNSLPSKYKDILRVTDDEFVYALKLKRSPELALKDRIVAELLSDIRKQ